MGLLQTLVTTAALLLISLTMLLRCHEFDGKGWRANLRKVGLVGSGFSPIGLVLGIWFGWSLEFYLSVFSVSLFLVFFTTPNGVPWEKWVWKSAQELEHEIEEVLDKGKL